MKIFSQLNGSVDKDVDTRRKKEEPTGLRPLHHDLRQNALLFGFAIAVDILVYVPRSARVILGLCLSLQGLLLGLLRSLQPTLFLLSGRVHDGWNKNIRYPFYERAQQTGRASQWVIIGLRNLIK